METEEDSKLKPAWNSKIKSEPTEAGKIYNKQKALQFFQYGHLPVDMQAISKPFCELANWVYESLPINSQRSKALGKILEAKDCAVRAKIMR